MARVVEQCSGTGELILNDQVIREVRYQLSVFQGISPGSGLPIPGQRTLSGRIDFDPARDSGNLVGPVLTLRLEDGRHVGIRLTGENGAIVEGRHGTGGCMCC